MLHIGFKGQLGTRIARRDARTAGIQILNDLPFFALFLNRRVRVLNLLQRRFVQRQLADHDPFRIFGFLFLLERGCLPVLQLGQVDGRLILQLEFKILDLIRERAHLLVKSLDFAFQPLDFLVRPLGKLIARVILKTVFCSLLLKRLSLFPQVGFKC